MSITLQYPHVDIDSEGVARLEGTRYKVVHLAAEHYCYGWTAEELLRQHPDLRPEQVYAALAYFYDNYDVLVEKIRHSASFSEAARENQPFSRNDLLSRKAKG